MKPEEITIYDTEEADETDFTDGQLEQLDAVDNTAFDLLNVLAVKKDGEDELDWNMELIGEVVDSAVAVLLAHGYSVYYPYMTEENGKTVVYDAETPDHSGMNL